jgi:hypothetical protein
MNNVLSYLVDYVHEVSVSYYYNDQRKFKSISKSLDVNDHIMEVYLKVKKLINDEMKGGRFDIYYKGKRIFAGDGPIITADSVRLIAELDAEISQDIYCTCKSKS